MVYGYKRIMSEFLEEIHGWDKICGRNSQDEDLSKVYENLVPSELTHKYSKFQPQSKLISDDYELHNIDSIDVLNIV